MVKQRPSALSPCLQLFLFTFRTLRSMAKEPKYAHDLAIPTPLSVQLIPSLLSPNINRRARERTV